MKRLLFITVLIVISSVKISATTSLSGTTNADFLKISPMARPAGMADAYGSLAEGTYALYYNPAGIPLVYGSELQATHIDWFQDINYEFISLVGQVPFTDSSDFGKAGVSFSWLSLGQMPRNSALPSSDPAYLQTADWSSFNAGTFSPYDFSLTLGYGLNLITGLSSGLNLHINSENIDSMSTSDFTVDLGILYKTAPQYQRLNFGLTLDNLGTAFGIPFSSPRDLKFSVSDALFDGALTLAFQSLSQFDYYNLYSIGGEYWLFNTVALRAGYRYGSQEYNQLSAGAGFRFGGFEVDYAFVNYGELGAAHRVSLVYGWGTPHVSLSVSPVLISPKGSPDLRFASFYPEIRDKSGAKSLKINIFSSNSADSPVAVVTASPSSSRVDWNGYSQSGFLLEDGVYFASVAVGYENGVSVSDKVKVEIDDTPPVMSVDADPGLNKQGESVRLMLPVTFSMSASDRHNVGGWKLVVLDSEKKTWFSTGGIGAPPASFIWDGKGDGGKYAGTGQVYYYYLASYDTLGNAGGTPLKSALFPVKEVKMSFSSDALFEVGDANVKISAYQILKGMKKTTDKYPGSDLVIAGYTDNIPPSGQKYRDNILLSKARAEAVKFFMVEMLGFDKDKIKTAGYGEQYPLASNDSDDGRQKNRRVEISIEATALR